MKLLKKYIMNTRSILTLLIGTLIFGVLFGYSLVFAWTWVFDNTTKIVFKSSENIYLDSLKLKNTKIMFRSWEDLSDYKIKSECNIFSKLKYNKWNYYLFDLKFFDNQCINNHFYIINENWETKLSFKLNLIKQYNVLSKLYDTKTERLIELKTILEKKIFLYSKYDKYNKHVENNYYVYLEKNRILRETIYNRDILENIIKNRNEKYIVPVIWRNIPVKHVKIPNSWRWYRKDYTDGVHHGWDIDWDFWEQVVALGEWIIVRTVKEFDFLDLNKIKRWTNLTYNEEVRNLDILRWKQVWLKTSAGDLVMYSHLNDVFSNIKVWEIVQKWQPLWTIWITWVPDKNYKDFHLHFVVHKNPFLKEKAGQYEFDDYMKWDWAFKWKPSAFIIENQSKYFENNTLLSKKGE